MSLEIWPSLPSVELKGAIDASQKRELDWQLNELSGTLSDLQQSLTDCYHLLGPSGRGNTLVVSTPRNEIVKGHITRLGTQIVKGTVHLRLRTLPHQTLTIDHQNPITITPLESLHTLLTRSIELLSLTLTYAYPSKDIASDDPQPPPFGGKTGSFIATQLRVLSQALSDASAILKGPSLTTADPAWTTHSVALSHFSPSMAPAISFYIGLQDSQLVLWLRALEPVGIPVNFGMKFALALGTTRRIEHDEADQVFTYCCEDGKAQGLHPTPNESDGTTAASPDGPAEVYVREKVRIESADPSLMSLSAKLSALSHTLHMARKNLAAVMGEDLDD